MQSRRRRLSRKYWQTRLERIKWIEWNTWRYSGIHWSVRICSLREVAIMSVFQFWIPYGGRPRMRNYYWRKKCKNRSIGWGRGRRWNAFLLYLFSLTIIHRRFDESFIDWIHERHTINNCSHKWPIKCWSQTKIIQQHENDLVFCACCKNREKKNWNAPSSIEISILFRPQ